MIAFKVDLKGYNKAFYTVAVTPEKAFNNVIYRLIRNEKGQVTPYLISQYRESYKKGSTIKEL